MSAPQIFELVKRSENRIANNLLDKIVNQCSNLLDNENSTLLHIATNSNNLEFIEILLERYDKLIEENSEKFTFKEKKKWINKKDNEGFTALHYSVFRSNHKIAFLLEKNGADIYSINTQGLTVLHIAAQGDSPLLMVIPTNILYSQFYYLNKGLKLGVTDSKGSTALHWACYSGQQNAVNALLSWGAEIDCQDFTYGMTPLHLAVMSGNGRIVKKLLIKGCDREIRNYNRKLPLDLANENQYKNIAEMIIDKSGIQELLNIKSPFRKINKKTFPYFFFLFAFFSNFILNVSFVVTDHITSQTQVAISYLILGLLCILAFILVSCKNPGYLQVPESGGNYFQMLLSSKPSNICFDCKIIKPLRSRHCQICNSCIKVYDHHCPWVGNCVGAKNYKYFFAFLILIETFVIFSVAFEILCLQHTDWQVQQVVPILRIISIFYGLATAILFILPLTQQSSSQHILYRFLVIVQLKNLTSNQTTFERYGYQAKSRRSTSISLSSVNSTLLKNQSDSSSIYGDRGSSLAASHHIQQTNAKNWNVNCFNMLCANSQNEKYQVAQY